ncbi:hypothetical protein Tco_1140593 [Tanacetum coccineum]
MKIRVLLLERVQRKNLRGEIIGESDDGCVKDCMGKKLDDDVEKDIEDCSRTMLQEKCWGAIVSPSTPPGNDLNLAKSLVLLLA